MKFNFEGTTMMNDHIMHLLKTVGRRRWLAKSLVFPVSPWIRMSRSSLHISYSVMREKMELFPQRAASFPSHNQVEEQKPRELSLLAKKIMEHSEQCSGMSVNETLTAEECVENQKNTMYSTDDLKKRLEALATNINDTLSESKDDSLLTQETNMFASPSEDQDDSVESIILRSDLEAIRTVKPSPLLGTEDPTVASSNIPCIGCGAMLQCQHNTFPGFLPSEHFKLLSRNELKTSLCQRCHYIRHCDAFIEVCVNPVEFEKMISKIKPTKSVVVMVVDVMDIYGSIIPNLANYIGRRHPLVIAGNKADLLAPDSPDYLQNVKAELKQACYNAGLLNVRKCTLISAKTGYGIEKLINHLFSLYRLRVDVYIVGTANAGKSSLFNTLLASDYCKHRARDLIQRATISVWPGTTLNLLKFPIMRPTTRTVALRNIRLQQEMAQKKALEKLKRERKKQKLSSWELTENVTVTDVRTVEERAEDDTGKAWGQKIHGFDARKDGTLECTLPEPTPFEPDEFGTCYWAYDTPGIINPNQIMNLLTTEEAPFLTPASMVIPRCLFVIPGDTVFVSGLARIDYLQGTDIVILTVHCGPDIPIKIVTTKEADQFYEQNVGTARLGIPIGDKDRLMKLPSLVGREFTVKAAADENIASADIQLSSIGWVSVAPRNDKEVIMKAYTPGLKGLSLRTPALMPRFRQFKGLRIKKTQYFKTMPRGATLTDGHMNLIEDNS